MSPAMETLAQDAIVWATQHGLVRVTLVRPVEGRPGPQRCDGAVSRVAIRTSQGVRCQTSPTGMLVVGQQ